MWKRWLPILLVVEVLCLVAAAGWAVHRRAAQQAPPPRITPAEWPYKETGNAKAVHLLAPPVPFRTDNPPADAFNLRPVGPEDVTDRSREKLEVNKSRVPAQEFPPGTKSFEFNGATVYYQPLGR